MWTYPDAETLSWTKNLDVWGTIKGKNITSGIDPGHKHSTMVSPDGGVDPAIELSINNQ